MFGLWSEGRGGGCRVSSLRHFEFGSLSDILPDKHRIFLRYQVGLQHFFKSWKNGVAASHILSILPHYMKKNIMTEIFI